MGQSARRPRHRATVVGFLFVGLIAVILSRVGYFAYFSNVPSGDTVGQVRIGIAALLPSWTPMVAVLVLAPIAILRAARDRTTWWMPLLALGLCAAGVLAAAGLVMAR